MAATAASAHHNFRGIFGSGMRKRIGCMVRAGAFLAHLFVMGAPAPYLRLSFATVRFADRLDFGRKHSPEHTTASSAVCGKNRTRETCSDSRRRARGVRTHGKCSALRCGALP